ncbi:hypothetical protein [Candidatus Methylopumilus planktonicus]|uniref:hypothetical protein n=1 Tax=Candidatus Methylopumilus planktonicus TaxID=1581557 RepID=UPI003BEEEA09
MNKNNFAVVVFTHKRAMQLHATLESLFEFISPSVKVHVIYHALPSHERSYEILKNDFRDHDLKFYKWGKRCLFDLFVKVITRPLNLIWLFRFPVYFKKYGDFKVTFENALKEVKEQFVMLSTDDQIFFRHLLDQEKIINLLLQDEAQIAFWSHVQPDFLPPYHFYDRNKPHANSGLINNDANKKIKWNTSKFKRNSLFAYRFHVDGTIYSKSYLLKLLKPTIYHLPTTLEAVGLWESRLRGYFKFGLMNEKRILIGVQANNIQTLSDTPHASFDVEYLQKAYISGFRLSVTSKDFIDKEYIYVPKDLRFNNKSIGLFNVPYIELAKYFDDKKLL